jgi:hypothetical protein
MKINCMSKSVIIAFLCIFIVFNSEIINAHGYSLQDTRSKDTGAMLRSFILPGWGHYYVNPDSWSTGRLYLGTDIILIGAYFGFSLNANMLNNNMTSFAVQHAGTDVSRFGRNYRLNVGDFSSIFEYNDFQERSRNWDRIYSDINQYYWNWDSDQKRREFVQLNNRVDRSKQQLPALFSLMIVNRVISGIHAYNASRNYSEHRLATLYVSQLSVSDGVGYQATLNIRF